MNIEKLSKRIEFEVEAQGKPCNADCPQGITMVGNTSVSFGKKTSCRAIITYSSFLSKKK